LALVDTFLVFAPTVLLTMDPVGTTIGLGFVVTLTGVMSHLSPKLEPVRQILHDEVPPADDRFRRVTTVMARRYLGRPGRRRRRLPTGVALALLICAVGVSTYALWTRRWADVTVPIYLAVVVPMLCGLTLLRRRARRSRLTDAGTG
jgi:hypothetical protein